MIRLLIKQLDAVKLAAIGVGILFLAVGCSTTYAEPKSNWQGFTYVVDQRSVDSLRRMLKDTGHKVIPWEKYKEGAVVKFNADCKEEYGIDSAFIAHTPFAPNMHMRYCLVSSIFPLPVIVAICRDLSAHLKTPLEFAWTKPYNSTFACGPPVRSKI